ncbi:IS110 family transposase [Planococcus sp. ISL-109]|uniref:IS110 family transposase n=1 Tax=Planococcus sp. ISL-109 TaxID=2819166 RepID=UPI001BE9531D|nr:IS110 family transposase [Planococcus sp. ISL-109]MBT2582183.1 IS110 family transposase [Planococcus sp. ISL-109]
MKHVIAFDVSMGKSYIVVYNALKTCITEKEIQHTREDFAALKLLIDDLTAGYDEVPHLVFESTGVYSRQLERFMQENSYPYYLMNPLEAKLQSDRLRNHKTDRVDAHQLASSHFQNERRLETPSSDVYRQLKKMSRHYIDLDDELTVIRGRLHAEMQLTFPELTGLFTTKSDLFLRLVQLFPHPELVLGHSKTVIKNQILANTEKRMSAKKAEEKAIQLLDAASNSYPAVKVDDLACELVRLYAKRFQELVLLKEACIEKMTALATSLDEYAVLLSIPGIGENTAVRLLAEIGDIQRFENHKQMNAFAGIDIRRYQSGKFLAKDRINKRGNKHLRKLLYIIIMNMIKQQRFSQNHLVDYYQKLKKQPYNKCHKVAVVACMNKLLKTIHHLVTHQLRYDYRLSPCTVAPKV